MLRCLQRRRQHSTLRAARLRRLRLWHGSAATRVAALMLPASLIRCFCAEATAMPARYTRVLRRPPDIFAS